MSALVCGFVSLIGLPNAGKSTLLNTFIGEKISIISSKQQTTRTHILGIASEDNTQIIFVDTPGLIFRPQGILQQFMVKTLWKSAKESDICLLLIDVSHPQLTKNEELLHRLLEKKQRVWIAFNKVDLIKKDNLLALAKHFQTFSSIEQFFMISGKKGSGTEDLKQALKKSLPEHPWLFPKEMISSMRKTFHASEITREKIFQLLHQEVPYKTHVETDYIHDPKDEHPFPLKTKKQLPKKGLSIFQTIFVEKSGQKQLILGHKGHRIKMIGQYSRSELSNLFQQPVHLFLHVKLAPDWEKSNPEKLFEQ